MARLIIFGFVIVAAALAEAQTSLIPAQNVIDARDCVMKLVAAKKNITLIETVPAPEIKPEGLHSLADFQDAAESFWGFRPEAYLNMYNPLKNEIFIMTGREYYDKYERSVFDSLAHEITHYLQHRYQNADFTSGDDSLEWDAIETQSWFRETYKDQMNGDIFVCPAN